MGRSVKKQGQGSRDEIRERMRLKCVGRVKQERAGQLARLRAGGAHRVTTMQPQDLAGMARSLVHEEFAGHGDAMMTSEEGGAGPRTADHFSEEVSLQIPQMVSLGCRRRSLAVVLSTTGLCQCEAPRKSRGATRLSKPFCVDGAGALEERQFSPPSSRAWAKFPPPSDMQHLPFVDCMW